MEETVKNYQKLLINILFYALVLKRITNKIERKIINVN